MYDTKASFGVILAWRIQLVRVPPVTTVFTVGKDLDDAETDVVDKWQKIANKLPNDLFIQVLLNNIVGKDIRKPKFRHAVFISLFLGNANDLFALVNKKFPELGLQEVDCKEMSWINTTLYFSLKANHPLEILRNWTVKATGVCVKGKSDFATTALPK